MRRLFNRFLLATLALIAPGTIPAWAGNNGWGEASNEEWAQGAPPEYPEANAVILHDICTLTVKISGIETTRWVRMKALNKAGAEEIGNASFTFHDGDKIRDLRAQTITPSGKKLKLDGKDFFTKTDGSLQVKTFAFPGVDSGCIVEYSFRNVNDRFVLLDPWFFQSNVFTLRSSFTLSIGAGFTYSSAWINVPGGKRQPTVAEVANADDPLRPLKVYTWQLNNLLPITEEPYMSARRDYLASMYYQLVSYKGTYQDVNFVKGWKDLGKEYQKLWFDSYIRGGDLDDLAKKITDGATTGEERVKRIYEYVSREIQTKSDPQGGYFTNNDLSALRKNGYGTGEEKNILLTELLKRSGVKAWPVLISTRSHRRFNPEINQIQQFNYMISLAQLDSSVIYLDASSKYCPFGMLPPECLVDGGFLIDGGNSELVKIVRSEPKTYRLDMTNMHLDSSGTVTCSTISRMSGYFAPDYGESAEDLAADEFLKQYFLDKLDVTYKLDSSSVDLDSVGQLVTTAKFTLPDYARTLDNNVAVKPVSFRYRANPFKPTKRFSPVDFNYPFTLHNLVVFTSDRNLKPAALPHDTTIAFEGVTFRRACQIAGDQIQVDTKLIVTTPVLPATKYRGLRDLFDAVAQFQDESIVLGNN